MSEAITCALGISAFIAIPYAICSHFRLRQAYMIIDLQQQIAHDAQAQFWERKLNHVPDEQDDWTS